MVAKELIRKKPVGTKRGKTRPAPWEQQCRDTLLQSCHKCNRLFPRKGSMDFDDLPMRSPSGMPSKGRRRRPRIFLGDPPDVIRYTPWPVWVMIFWWVPVLIWHGLTVLYETNIKPRMEEPNGAEVQMGRRPRRVVDR